MVAAAIPAAGGEEPTSAEEVEAASSVEDIEAEITAEEEITEAALTPGTAVRIPAARSVVEATIAVGEIIAAIGEIAGTAGITTEGWGLAWVSPWARERTGTAEIRTDRMGTATAEAARMDMAMIPMRTSATAPIMEALPTTPATRTSAAVRTEAERMVEEVGVIPTEARFGLRFEVASQ